jgi:hypothetical protein
MNLRGRISELRKLAESDDWWDREIAGFALRNLIEDHFANSRATGRSIVLREFAGRLVNL